MKSLSRVPSLLRAAAGALFAVALLSACAKPEPAPVPVRPVQLAQVKQGGAADTAVFAGEVKPRHESDLGFRIAGKVIARSVDMGARVTRGQTLARLDPPTSACRRTRKRPWWQRRKPSTDMHRPNSSAIKISFARNSSASPRSIRRKTRATPTARNGSRRARNCR